MRRRRVQVFVLGMATVCGAGLLAAAGTSGAWAASATRGAAVPAISSWGRAIEVPGLGALNKGGNASVYQVACTSPGNCAAGGYYTDGHHHQQGFVGVQKNGVWDQAIEAPGLGALNKGGYASVDSLSCATAGSCAAGGYYADGARHLQGFVAVEKNGIWSRAIEVPGLGALNAGGSAIRGAGVGSVSCPSPGNCAAGGEYTDSAHHQQGFVAVEKKGVWGQAIEVPGLGTRNTGGYAGVFSVSCTSAGSCLAGGSYEESTFAFQGFVISEKNGVWGTAMEIPGLRALNTGGYADVFSVSCRSPGNYCAAAGDYSDSGSDEQGFVAVEKNGVWGKAFQPPGLAALSAQGGGNNAAAYSVSCPSPGNCTAIGSYGMPYGIGFVAPQTNGVWGEVTDLGLTGRVAGANAVSCASPGNCAAVGFYSNDLGDIDQGWVASERHGTWVSQIEVPGLGALNKGGSADAGTVSCPPAGGCAAGGEYTDGHGHQQGFVVNAK